MQNSRRELLAMSAAVTALAAYGQGKAASSSASTASDLIKLDATGQAALVKDGHVKAIELVQAAIERLERLEPKLNAFADVNFDQALAAVKNAEHKDSAFFGVPFAMKDLNEYPGLRYQRGSKMLKGNLGTKRTAYTKKLDEMGLVTLGKTTTPEFGLLPVTEPLLTGPTRNPWNLEHSPGGSSGGAAAAVASRILPMAQASDGGGSIRIPANFSGLLGLKPSRGRFPDQGYNQKIAISIKHVLSLSVRDSAICLYLAQTKKGALPAMANYRPAALESQKIALTLTTGEGKRVDAEVEAAVLHTAKLLEARGHQIIETEDTPAHDPSLADAFTLLWASGAAQVYEAAKNMTGKPPEETGILENWTIGLAKRFAANKDRFGEALAQLERLSVQTHQFLNQYDAWLSGNRQSSA